MAPGLYTPVSMHACCTRVYTSLHSCTHANTLESLSEQEQYTIHSECGQPQSYGEAPSLDHKADS